MRKFFFSVKENRKEIKDGARSLELELENARYDEEEEEKKGEDWRKEGIEHVRVKLADVITRIEMSEEL